VTISHHKLIDCRLGFSAHRELRALSAARQIETADNAKLMEHFVAQEVIRRALLDPYVLLDPGFRIIECNDMFRELSKAKSMRDLIGSHLGEIFTFEVQDKNLPLEEIFTDGVNRLDEIRMHARLQSDEKRKQRSGGIIIIGSLAVKDGSDLLGYFSIVRDVTQESSLQVEYDRKFQMSVTDALTGMRNRAFLQQYLQTQFSQFSVARDNPEAAENASFCVLMTDIDHFKKINDTFGHQAGDHILKQISAVISQSLRKTDVVCRYGGEEFLITLVNVSESVAKRIAEKIRATIELSVFEFEGKKIPVTSSFGISKVLPSDNQVDEVVKRADAALYQSKRGGRNRVTFSS
jgi:diguanylate cyclase (GGDEF)-like protein